MIVKKFELDGVKYATKQVKATCVLWETTCGKWVRKVIAAREGLLLTGNFGEFESTPAYVTLTDVSTFKPNPFAA